VTNILTDTEAAGVLRKSETDAEMLRLLPLVDAYIKNATGRDWTIDSPIRPEAKNAARILLVKWDTDPGSMADAAISDYGLPAAMAQQKDIKRHYKEFPGRDGTGPVSLAGVRRGDTVSTLTGLVGVTGDQHAAFETVITVDGQIQQISSADLSEKMFRAFILKPGEL
jgi:hypothetical protein